MTFKHVTGVFDWDGESNFGDLSTVQFCIHYADHRTSFINQRSATVSRVNGGIDLITLRFKFFDKTCDAPASNFDAVA